MGGKRSSHAVIIRKRFERQEAYNETHPSSSSIGDNFQLQMKPPRKLCPSNEKDCEFSVEFAANCKKEHQMLVAEEALGFPGRAQTFKVMVACRFSLLCKKNDGI